MPPRQPFWLLIAPAIFLLLWSGGYPVAKLGLQFTGPMTLLTVRFGLVVAVMAALLVLIRPSLPTTREEWGHLAIVGFLIQVIYFGMSYVAFQAGVAAGTAALIMSFQPVVVALIAPRWSGETVSRNAWIGLSLGLVGCAVVIAARSVIETPSIFGFAAAVMALAGITAGSLWEKRFGIRQHPVVTNFVGYLAGFMGIFPAMFLLETPRIEWTWTFAAVLFYLVVGNSLIAVGLLLAMIRAGDVARVSALLFLVPPLAALLAWIFLGEVMPLLAWCGMAVAAVGVYLATRR